jgi:hypothetical protein
MFPVCPLAEPSVCAALEGALMVKLAAEAVPMLSANEPAMNTALQSPRDPSEKPRTCAGSSDSFFCERRNFPDLQLIVTPGALGRCLPSVTNG